MNDIFRRLMSALLVLATTFVFTACASHGEKKTASTGDGDKVFASAVIRVDSIVRKNSELEGTVYELDAIQIGFKEPNGQWVEYFDKEQKKMVPAITRFHRETKTTPFGQTVTLTVISTVGVAATQGEYAKKIAKLTTCKPGSVCGENIIFNEANALGLGGTAMASGGHANAQQGQTAAATAGSQLNNNDCKTCGVQPKPVTK